MTGNRRDTTRGTEVRVVRVGIPLDRLAANPRQCIDSAFAGGEQAWAVRAPVRSLAGRLAAKHALNTLVGRGADGLAAWEIGTDPDGAPRVVGAPFGCPGDWHLSISHTRTTAWAMAARVEPEAGP